MDLGVGVQRRVATFAINLERESSLEKREKYPRSRYTAPVRSGSGSEGKARGRSDQRALAAFRARSRADGLPFDAAPPRRPISRRYSLMDLLKYNVQLLSIKNVPHVTR